MLTRAPALAQGSDMWTWGWTKFGMFEITKYNKAKKKKKKKKKKQRGKKKKPWKKHHLIL